METRVSTEDCVGVWSSLNGVGLGRRREEVEPYRCLAWEDSGISAPICRRQTRMPAPQSPPVLCPPTVMNRKAIAWEGPQMTPSLCLNRI